MPALDLKQFALLAFSHRKLGGQVELAGRIPLSNFPRFSAEKTPDTPAESPIAWSLHSDGQVFQGHPSILLCLRAEIFLVCQRCLEPYLQNLALQRRLVLVQTQAQVDAEPIDKADIDFLVGSDKFDLLDLLEEQLMLNLPLIPKHSSCDPPVLTQMRREFLAAEAPSPFATLASMKQANHC
jgi:uncharacterized protein